MHRCNSYSDEIFPVIYVSEINHLFFTCGFSTLNDWSLLPHDSFRKIEYSCLEKRLSYFVHCDLHRASVKHTVICKSTFLLIIYVNCLGFLAARQPFATYIEDITRRREDMKKEIYLFYSTTN